MSSNDDTTTTQLKPKYQLQSNPRSFELIFLNSWSSRWYHQAFTSPPSFNTTPTKNSGLDYTTSIIYQSPFGRVNELGMLVPAPTFLPSPYIPLQVITFTPIYTMEVKNSFRRLEKFNGRPGTISLREFKVIFSTVVCELEFKYGVNYIEAFACKQLARYVHYEALDVY